MQLLRCADGQEGQQGGARRKRRAAADSNPSVTLESSWEALNVKKFDLAFAVDPLFHRMSAQFDEGGARGGLPLLCLGKTLTIFPEKGISIRVLNGLLGTGWKHCLHACMSACPAD